MTDWLAKGRAIEVTGSPLGLFQVPWLAFEATQLQLYCSGLRLGVGGRRPWVVTAPSALLLLQPPQWPGPARPPGQRKAVVVEDEARGVGAAGGAAQQQVVGARLQAQAATGQVGAGHPGLPAAVAHRGRWLLVYSQHAQGQPPPCRARCLRRQHLCTENCGEGRCQAWVVGSVQGPLGQS